MLTASSSSVGARFVLTLAVSAAVAMTSACAGDGVITVRASGEAQATEGLAAAQLADGWAVSFAHFIVHIEDVVVGAVGLERSFLIDAAHLPGTPPVVELDEVVVAPGRHDVGYTIAVASADDVRLFVDDDAADAAIDAGAAVFIEATATKDDRDVTLALALPTAVRHDDCTNGSTGKAGVVAASDGGGVADITLHVEHLFYDTLGTEAARLRFDAFAELADADGHVDTAALAAAPLDTSRYDAASFEAESLLDFLRLSVASLGHLGGSGLCSVSRLGDPS